ncbi:unnamed protein product [Schistocephalus solidus]|uniref:EF-hand_13 domain-containing protein n=1 Tax=Schistocephalus solidus TaxID=70667 RepID=A0A183T046_SCHSO|nr:unnamed protein product [Schistocephalus solidus]
MPRLSSKPFCCRYTQPFRCWWLVCEPSMSSHRSKPLVVDSRVADRLARQELGVPNPDTLVQISRCGGSSADLLRLEDIIKTKLGGDLDGVNAYDFLRLFASAAVVFPDSGTFPSPGDQEACTGQAESVEEARPDDGDDDDEVFMANGAVGSCGGGGNKITGQRLLSPISRGCSRSLPDDPHSASSACELTGTLPSTAAPQGRRMYDLWSAMTSRLVVSLCSLEVYRYRPATLALSILLQLRVVGVPGLARLCNVKMDEVRQCGTLVEELYDIYYLDAHPSNRRALVWTLSRRTLCRIGCSSPTPLDTISEDCDLQTQIITSDPSSDPSAASDNEVRHRFLDSETDSPSLRDVGSGVFTFRVPVADLCRCDPTAWTSFRVAMVVTCPRSSGFVDSSRSTLQANRPSLLNTKDAAHFLPFMP